MASHDDSQERTEQATPKRLQEAAEQGQIARSRELTTAGLLLGAAGGLLMLGPSLVAGLATQLRAGLMQDTRQVFASSVIPAALGQALADLLLLLAPFLALMVGLALLAPLALGGWNFSTKAWGLKWERLNPIKGLGRLFSQHALLELLKALAKFFIIGSVAVALLWAKQPELLHLGSEPLFPALAHMASVLGWIFLVLGLPLLGIAMVDVPFQLFSHARQLRMSHQELREEQKETEGRPELKNRIRHLQQEFAQRRMMDKVPQADVVITNPTHYAVALKYDQATLKAPLVVAKGVDLIATTLCNLATNHQVPRVESPLLARALYFNSELDKPIPAALYMAVAQVLAYLYQLRQEDRLETTPIAMPEVPVPPELRTK